MWFKYMKTAVIYSFWDWNHFQIYNYSCGTLLRKKQKSLMNDELIFSGRCIVICSMKEF